VRGKSKSCSLFLIQKAVVGVVYSESTKSESSVIRGGCKHDS
jgi:hypothetical protein